jgi:hypothetical protein
MDRDWEPLLGIVPVVLLAIALVLVLAEIETIGGVDVLASGQEAVGYLAAGDFSVGVLSAGTFSVGLFSAGIFAVGVFSIGIFSVGLFSVGLYGVGFYVASKSIEEFRE